jgi:hypothetical protein
MDEKSTLYCFAVSHDVCGVLVPAKGAHDENDVNEIGNRKVAHRSIVSQEREIATGKQFAAEIDAPRSSLTIL